MDIDVIEPPGDLDPLGKVSQVTLSDFVGAAQLSYQFLFDLASYRMTEI